MSYCETRELHDYRNARAYLIACVDRYRAMGFRSYVEAARIQLADARRSYLASVKG